MHVLGLNAKLYHGSSGSKATTEITNVKDLKLGLEWSTADITNRASGKWKSETNVLLEASLEWDMLYNTEDAGFTAIRNAFFNSTAISLFVSDGSGNGLDADFIITGFDVDQSLEEAATVSVTAKPTSSDRTPAWVTSSSSGA